MIITIAGDPGSGKSTIGKRETIAKGKPSFVQRVTRNAITPKGDACAVLNIKVKKKKSKIL